MGSSSTVSRTKESQARHADAVRLCSKAEDLGAVPNSEGGEPSSIQEF